MDDFGPHTNLVEEVLTFALQGDILVLQSVPTSVDVSLLSDYERARELVFSATFGKLEQTWTDIRDLETSKVYGNEYRDLPDLRISDKLNNMLSNLTARIREKLPQKFRRIASIIAGDILECCRNRAVNGYCHSFYENMFEIYKAGCWPCGWEGDWPEGKFIAYKPFLDEEQVRDRDRVNAIGAQAPLPVELLIRRICSERGLHYLGSHAIDVGQYAGAPCARVVCHIKEGNLEVLVTDTRALVRDKNGAVLAVYEGFSKKDLFSSEEK